MSSRIESGQRGALLPYVEKHMAAVLEPTRADELLRAIDGYVGQPTTRAAVQLSALLFQRPGNFRAMEWAGFRAMARTLMVERMQGIDPDVIEAQLAHGRSGPLGMAYDHAEFMDQRRRMMVLWADYLDALRKARDREPC